MAPRILADIEHPVARDGRISDVEESLDQCARVLRHQPIENVRQYCLFIGFSLQPITVARLEINKTRN